MNITIKNVQPWRAPRQVELQDTRGTRPVGTGQFVEAWGGWEWETPLGRFRTDDEGEGLWTWNQGRGEWTQVQGAGQFSLPRDRKAARRKLRRILLRWERPLL